IISVQGDDTRRYGASVSWMPIVRIAKVSAIGTNPCTVKLDVQCDATHPTECFKPFLLRIPVGTVTDGEVIRLYRALLPNVPVGAQANEIATFSHQLLNA